ncbi:MAG: transposase [Thermodesulfobacteriota bacterium]|nr:transposase [Thermodesulfobacteriota bacterium]
MPRQPRIDSPGLLHHIIFRGIEQCNIVKDDTDRLNFVSRLDRLSRECNINVYAWALLDNHVHLLVRSSDYGLAHFMRRLLTGHATTFNLRYKRHGHLFQNRYKSIVCDEECYFLELVRYIHLNPIRAGIIKTLEELRSYPWCGHAALVNRTYKSWQNRDAVLLHFGKKKKHAKENYELFLADGLNQGERPELIGGGLRRSQPEVGEVNDQPEAYDDRILGNGAFVEQILQQNEVNSTLVSPHEKQHLGDEFVKLTCMDKSITLQEIQSGSRCQAVSQARRIIATELVQEYGWSSTAVARCLGVSTSAICKILARARLVQ